MGAVTATYIPAQSVSRFWVGVWAGGGFLGHECGADSSTTVMFEFFGGGFFTTDGILSLLPVYFEVSAQWRPNRRRRFCYIPHRLFPRVHENTGTISVNRCARTASRLHSQTGKFSDDTEQGCRYHRLLKKQPMDGRHKLKTKDTIPNAIDIYLMAFSPLLCFHQELWSCAHIHATQRQSKSSTNRFSVGHTAVQLLGFSRTVFMCIVCIAEQAIK